MPAGNFDKLKYALMYGADAVYCGIPDFSLRMRVNEFDREILKEAVEYTHNLGKTIYVTVNTFPHKESIEKLKDYLKFLDKIKPDALIISDPGVIALTQELTSLPIHLSVQANTVNAYSAKFWHKQGVERIVIARELNLEEIQEIKNVSPDLELETFVHGAMCMSYSGRCLLSNFMTYRDSNQGDCAQSCRWKYKVHQAKKTKSEILRKEIKTNDFVLEEQLRPKEYYPIEEDENGTHIMSSRDLCLIEHLKDLYKTGVISFKVEGRSKTIYYVATIARAYRKAIDDFMTDKPFDPNLITNMHFR
jgi:putative protease